MFTEVGLANNHSQSLCLGRLTLQTQENQALTFPAFLTVHYGADLQLPRNKHSLSRAFQEKLIFLKKKKRVTYLRVKQPMVFSFRAEIIVSLNIRVRLIYTRNHMPRDLCKKKSSTQWSYLSSSVLHN